ncbi:MAG: ABC transporter ATP-binding protein [Chloroflexota bacterium]|nr:ABC transporter ATP-binding protein [Chloroflexota bacterium]
MIKLENVTKVYPDGTEAVKDVSFEVEKGELCVLLGPSGCGKTTTMKMINRLIPISSGAIYLDGEDVTKVNENELRRNIGYAIQEIGLFPHMTVGQNIETVPVLKGWAKAKRRERARELLGLVRLDPDETLGKYPSELSGGQRQRVGLARALAADPPTLLMDEPFGAIDPITRVELQNEFLKIQQEITKTIVFVTHDIYEAIKMGDKIAMMRDGRLVQFGTPAELTYRPKDSFVEDFIGADRALKGLQLIRVKDVMDASPPTVRADEKAAAGEEGMRGKGVDWLAVIDENGRLTGWLSWLDSRREEMARDVMTPPQVVANESMVLNEALSMMLSANVMTLPVVDARNRLRGVLTFDDIRRGLSEASEGQET